MSKTYSKSQVEEILRRAARSTAEAEAAAGTDSGLTLDDLKQIGTEAGLRVEEVVAAARVVELEIEESNDVNVFGINVGVAHAVYLPGRMTDEEWNTLVSDCRKTFLAKGNINVSGSLREWSNGNLVVTAESHGDDTLLRMRSHRGVARQQLGGAIAALSMLLLMTMVGLFGEGIESSFYVALLVVGAVTMALGMSATLGTKSWAKTRKGQMEQMASRAGARRASVVKPQTENQADLLTAPDSLSTLDFDDPEKEHAPIPSSDRTKQR